MKTRVQWRRGYLALLNGSRPTCESDRWQQLITYPYRIYIRKENDLAGVIFLYRISDNRVSGSLLKDLRLFEAVCGKDMMKNVVISTTMWTITPKDAALRRQTELETNYFKDMLGSGCKLEIFGDSRESALATVNHILNLPPCRLLIQNELAQQKPLEDTSAGKVKRGFWGKLPWR